MDIRSIRTPLIAATFLVGSVGFVHAQTEGGGGTGGGGVGRAEVPG